MTDKDFLQNLTDSKHIVIAYSMKLESNKEKALELVQEVLSTSYMYRHTFKEGSNFKAWITTITRNKYIDRYRLRKKIAEREVFLDYEELTPPDKSAYARPSSQLYYDDLKQAIDNLPDKFRIPFWMHYEGYKYEEISETLVVPIGTIKSRIFKARKALQSQLQHLR